MTFLVPVSAVILGTLALGEALVGTQLVGMAIIGVGLAAIDGRLLRLLFTSPLAGDVGDRSGAKDSG